MMALFTTPGIRLCTSACAVVLVAAPAFAGSVTLDVPITIQSPPKIALNPPVPSVVCTAPAATVVAGLSLTGGDGNPATYTATGGDTADFSVSGSNLVVGANGIAAANCPPPGQTNVENISIKADQP